VCDSQGSYEKNSKKYTIQILIIPVVKYDKLRDCQFDLIPDNFMRIFIAERLNQRQFKVARFFANRKNRDALNCPLDFFC